MRERLRKKERKKEREGEIERDRDRDRQRDRQIDRQRERERERENPNECKRDYNENRIRPKLSMGENASTAEANHQKRTRFFCGNLSFIKIKVIFVLKLFFINKILNIFYM